MPRVEKQTPALNTRPKATIPTSPSETVVRNGKGKSAWDMAAGIRMLLYGQSRTGKTTLWATFPGPILALICSGGGRPGELRSIDTPEYRKKIDARIVTSTSDLVEMVADAADFGTVVLDHASGLADLILKELLGLEDILIAKYRVAGKGESWSVVSQQQYGQLAIQCKETFRSLLNLPTNVVIVAQERTFGEEGVSEIIQPTVGAALTPSVAGWLNPACDFVVQTFLRNKTITTNTNIGGKDVSTTKRGAGVEYCLRTAPHDIFMTKFRVPRGREIPDCLVDPTYQKIMSIIRGE